MVGVSLHSIECGRSVTNKLTTISDLQSVKWQTERKSKSFLEGRNLNDKLIKIYSDYSVIKWCYIKQILRLRFPRKVEILASL